MKKLFITIGAVLLFALTSTTSEAQTQKGNWEISGSSNVGFSTVNTKYKANGLSVDGETVNSFNITPAVSYFIADNLGIGVGLGINSRTTKDGTDKYVTSTISILPSVFYYFTNSNIVKPFLGARAGYASITDKVNSTAQTSGGFAWEIDGGVSYFVSPSIAINTGLGYGQLSYKQTILNTEVTSLNNTFGAQIGFSFFIK